MAHVTTDKAFGHHISFFCGGETIYSSQMVCKGNKLYLSAAYPNGMTVMLKAKDREKIIQHKIIRILGQILISERT